MMSEVNYQARINAAWDEQDERFKCLGSISDPRSKATDQLLADARQELGAVIGLLEVLARLPGGVISPNFSPALRVIHLQECLDRMTGIGGQSCGT
jgi:hypothetical protein